MSRRKEMKVLVKGLTKYLKPISDEGTWKERKGKHLNISCKHKGCHMHFTFPLTPSPSGVSNTYGMVRRKLANCGLSDERFTAKMITSHSDTDYSMDEFYRFLEKQERLLTKVEGIFREDVGPSSASRYIREAKTVQKSVVTQKKPYKRKTTYFCTRRDMQITYDSYYVWASYFRRDDTQVTGFLRATRDQYQTSLAKWKKRKKK